MRNSNAVEVARKMDEMDLALLQLIAKDFSSILKFSEQWITSRSDHDILSCGQRLQKFRDLGLIQEFKSMTDGETNLFVLSDPEAAEEVLRVAHAPMSN